MLFSKPQLSLKSGLIAGMFLILAASCSVIPKNYPTDKPFVYETNINLEGKFTKDEKDNLQSQLKNQLHDSLRVRTIYKFFYRGFNRPVLMNPPVFDSVNAEQSIKFMRSLLNARGYFRDSISYDTSMVVKADTHSPQQRTIIDFNVTPGKLVKLDSIYFNLNKPEFQSLAEATKKNMLLKKGDAFSIQNISQEFNRLVDLYRENGYLRFSREEIVGIWDTLNIALLKPTFDPFEQILLLEELKKKRDSPTANLEIRLRQNINPERLKKYYVGHTTIYPDYNADTVGLKQETYVYDKNISIVSYRNLFKKQLFTNNIYFKYGDLYNQKNFLKTINRFNTLGAWRLVNLEQEPRAETDTVDFSFYLTPANKYSFTANFEGSSNNDFLFDTRLLGIGISAQLVNRNFGRASNKSSTSIRYGTEVETKGEFVKSRQASISHSIFFPKSISKANWLPLQYRDNFRNVLSFALGNEERKDYYNYTFLNTSWGYNLNWINKKERSLAAKIKVPNVEYAFLNPRPLLDSIFLTTPSFRYIFNTGLVVSFQGGFQIRGGKGNAANVLRVNFEESGLLVNYIKLKAFDSLFRFIKQDAEFIRHIHFGKSSFIIRAFAGAGFALETRTRTTNLYLPFFKQFYAGGANSMRAWGLQTLGPGSTLKTREEVPFRFGDFQFETNAEFRFPVTKINKYSVNSCLFTDIGNVWFLKENPDFPDGTLTASKFIKDLAFGIGTGLRFDFDFFLLRLDYSIKIKNPSPEPYNAAGQNKWFYDFNPFGGIVQFAINYPFNF